MNKESSRACPEECQNDKNVDKIDFGLLNSLIPQKCIEVLDETLEETLHTA